MKKRKIINIHTLIVISSIVLFSLALLACPEITLNEKKHSLQTIKTPAPPSNPQDSQTQDSQTQDSQTQDSQTQDSQTQDSQTQDSQTQDSSDLQASLQCTFSEVLYIAAKSKQVPKDTIVDENKNESAHTTIFNALGIKAGDKLNFRYVKSTGNDDNDGTTWIKAKQSIEATLDAISNASDNNPYLMLIGSGTYTSTKTLNMKNHVAIIGGFNTSSNKASGYETDGKTIISGENKRQVFKNTNLNKSAVLARVTIKNGKAQNGGGMYNANSSPTITHTTFSKNTANSSGGGMYNANSSPTITHTTFSKNTANSSGGGMYNANSSPTITHTTFSKNTANSSGGGMYNANSSPTITHTTFSKNNAEFYGGGMYNIETSPTITHTIFSQNNANSSGGGMYNEHSSPTITHTTFSKNTANYGGGMGMSHSNHSFSTIKHTTFSQNTATNDGGGIFNSNSFLTITHTIFSKNTANRSGGGMYNIETSPTITHTIFSQNNANRSGGGLYNSQSHPIISNSVFWGNTKNNTLNQITDNHSSTPNVRDSTVQGGYKQGTNIKTKTPLDLNKSIEKQGRLYRNYCN